jgi:hypothetical protein
MKKFSRVTSSIVITATLLSVIIGSLCFSAGEGLRLTPFPSPTISSSLDAGDLNDAGTISEVVIAKYGPLDVPAQTQKRGKRHSVDLVCDAATGTRPFVAPVVKHSVYTTELPNPLSFIAPHSGRAPPFQS